MLQGVARALGMFSAVLGTLQLLAPRHLLRAIGIEPTPVAVVITRLVGIRELGVVPGLLASSKPFGWLAARVAGDVKDLALLGVSRPDARNRPARIAVAMGAVGGVLALDAFVAMRARQEARRQARHGGRIVRAVTIERAPEELYRFWRSLENLPTVMPHLERVEVGDAGRSHWVARAPIGTVEWDAEVVEDRPGELIAWRSVDGSQVRNAGLVRFAAAAGSRGTEVILEMDVEVPGGPLGSALAMLSGEDPRQQVSDALRRFKQVMETGEPIRSEATVEGRKLRQRPAEAPDEEQRREVLVAAAGSTGGAP